MMLKLSYFPDHKFGLTDSVMVANGKLTAPSPRNHPDFTSPEVWPSGGCIARRLARYSSFGPYGGFGAIPGAVAEGSAPIPKSGSQRSEARSWSEGVAWNERSEWSETPARRVRAKRSANDEYRWPNDERYDRSGAKHQVLRVTRFLEVSDESFGIHNQPFCLATTESVFQARSRIPGNMFFRVQKVEFSRISHF